MVLCTRIYTFVSYRILNMKRKDTKSKALSSCFSGKLNVSSLEGTRFKPCFLPFVCTQIFLGVGVYLHYMCICFILYLRFSFSSYCDHYPFHIAPFRFLFIQFSRHCRKSSRHPPPPNRTSSDTCQEKSVRFRLVSSNS